MSFNTPSIRVENLPVPPLESLKESWIDLELRSNASFFNSWTWIGAWLEHIPRHVERRLLRAACADRVVGLAVICSRTVRRARVIPSRTLFIHATGDPELDELTVEHNRHLAEAGMEDAVARAFADDLLKRKDWDEISFPGWSGDIWMGRGAELRLREGTGRAKPCRQIELGRLRREGAKYLDRLSSGVRYKVRRALKEADSLGEVRLEVASSPLEAVEFLAQLERLHQNSWGARGEPGSFANPGFKHFHEGFVLRESATGKVQLLRLSVGKLGVGYLYNMLHGGHVLQYQSGFDYEVSDSTSWRPGIICHTLAIEHYLAGGMETFDFLAGDQRYKRDLATSSVELSWSTLQRPRLRFDLERKLRKCVGFVKHSPRDSPKEVHAD